MEVTTGNNIYCSFCHKTQQEVHLIIAGKTGNICNECIPACIETMNGYFEVLANNLQLAKDKAKHYQAQLNAKPAQPDIFESHKGEE